MSAKGGSDENSGSSNTRSMERRRRRNRGDDHWLYMGRLDDWRDVREERPGGGANGSRGGVRAPLRGQGRAEAGAAHPPEEAGLLLTPRLRGQSRMGF